MLSWASEQNMHKCMYLQICAELLPMQDNQRQESLTLLLARLGVGAPAADPLGLLIFFCFTGAEAGRLLPGASQLNSAR